METAERQFKSEIWDEARMIPVLTYTKLPTQPHEKCTENQLHHAKTPETFRGFFWAEPAPTT